MGALGAGALLAGAAMPTLVGAAGKPVEASLTNRSAKPKASAKQRPWYDLGRLNDPVLDSQLLWYLSAVYQGTADIGECLDTASRVQPEDPWSWPREWERTAERLRRSADDSLAGGHRLSAGQSYLRASTYYRAALIHHPEPQDPGVVAMTRLAVSCFDRAIDLLALPARAVRIPYEGTTLPGYFHRSPVADVRAPVLIVFEGRDAWPEETKYLADAAMARGYHCLQFAGPGQGAAIRLQGLTFRPDWEKVVTPVVDFAISQPGVDADRIALMGLSMGGALAPRAAAFEKRIKVLIANPGVLSWADSILGHFEDYPLLTNLVDTQPALFDKVCWGFFDAASHLGDNLMGAATWWLKDSMWKHGVSSPSNLIRELRRYTNADVVDKITCQVLIMDGAGEDFSAGQAMKLYDALACPKEYMLFTAEDTGLLHCQTGAMAVATQRMFDWLDDRL